MERTSPGDFFPTAQLCDRKDEGSKIPGSAAVQKKAVERQDPRRFRGGKCGLDSFEGTVDMLVALRCFIPS